MCFSKSSSLFLMSKYSSRYLVLFTVKLNTYLMCFSKSFSLFLRFQIFFSVPCPIHSKIKYVYCRIISTLLVLPIANKSYPLKFSSLSFRLARFNGVDRKFYISTIVSHFLRQSLVLAYWKRCTIQFLHHTEYTMWPTIPLNMPTTLPGNSNATIFCGNKQLNVCWLLLCYLGNDVIRHSNGSNPASRSPSYFIHICSIDVRWW